MVTLGFKFTNIRLHRTKTDPSEDWMKSRPALRIGPVKSAFTDSAQTTWPFGARQPPFLCFQVARAIPAKDSTRRHKIYYMNFRTATAMGRTVFEEASQPPPRVHSSCPCHYISQKVAEAGLSRPHSTQEISPNKFLPKFAHNMRGNDLLTLLWVFFWMYSRHPWKLPWTKWSAFNASLRQPSTSRRSNI